ncbi:MAG: N-acetyltransferase family protein [Planctomycetota bacterium]
MAESDATIEALSVPVADADLEALAQLLVAVVDEGAAVSFVQPLSSADAAGWWRRTLASAPPKAVFLVARDADGIVGTVQLQPAWAPNQPHRAEVVKLLVHRRARGRGTGRRLMLAIEDAARASGFTLLTLDARRDGPAERLYRAMGWTVVGVIPDFAVNADHSGLHDTVVFYKRLA